MKKNNDKHTKTIKVDYIARVEGEGALLVEIEGDTLKDVQLKIFEPPRFFEAFLRGRDYTEAPDITARICGICPVAYQMSAVHAMEDALDISVEGQLAELRRLLYCGEWVESHVLHIYMLHAPDFLGFPDVMTMAKKYPEEVKRGLRMKKAGNGIVALLGGREIHPINVRVGGFYRVPEKKELLAIADELKWARDAAIESTRWVAQLDFPDYEKDYEFVSVSHPDFYPLDVGRVKSNRGLNITAHEYEEHIEELHVGYTHALQSRIKGRGSYLAGPMARHALNYENLSPLTKQVAEEINFTKPCLNPFKSIIVRSLEVLYAFDEALRVIESYEKPKASSIPITLKAGTGYACTEAPRGILYHRYQIDDEGTIEVANIIPPTSQNQKSIEEDIRNLLEKEIDKSEEELTSRCEHLIRNYDPCISCATHFLKLDLKRS